jgi:hypothetical protein
VTLTTPSSPTPSVVAAAVGATNSALAAVGSQVPTYPPGVGFSDSALPESAAEARAASA